MNQRAQGEVTIREAIRELDLWGAGAQFALTEYDDSNKNQIHLIKDWKEIVNQVRAKKSYMVCFTVMYRNKPKEKLLARVA